MISNQRVGLTVVFIGILISLAYSMVLSYLENTSKIDYKLWDVSTCTPADYTVELRIPPDAYEAYKADPNKVPFDQYIRETFEKFVSELPHRDDDEAGPVKIACMSFGYANGDLIRLLY